MITEWHRDGVFPSHGWECDSGMRITIDDNHFGPTVWISVPSPGFGDKTFGDAVAIVPAFLADLFERTAAELVEYKYKKRISEGPKPISCLFIPLMQEALELCTWNSEHAKLEDLSLLRRWATEILRNEQDAANERRALTEEPHAQRTE